MDTYFIEFGAGFMEDVLYNSRTSEASEALASIYIYIYITVPGKQDLLKSAGTHSRCHFRISCGSIII